MSTKVGRPKGQEKTGGRKKGTPNKLTKELKGELKQIITDELAELPELLEELDPLDRITLITKLLPYVLPKVESTAYHLDEPLAVETIEAQPIN